MAGSVNNTRGCRLDNPASGCKPFEHVQSMGDDFIEDLAYNQQDKNFSLQKLLNKEKEFQPSHTFKPITEYNQGTSSLQSFISHVESNEPKPSTSDASSPADPYLGLSRHEFDILNSVKPNSETTKLLTFALSNKKSNERGTSVFVPENHPINHLKDLHDQVFTDGDPIKTANTILRKRKQLLQYYSEPIGPEPKSSKPNSLWDVKDLPSHTATAKREYTVARPPSAENSKNNYSLNEHPFNSSNKSDRTKRNEPQLSRCESKLDYNRGDAQTNSQSQKPPAKSKVDSGGQPFVAPSDCQLSETELRLIPRFSEDEIRQIPRFQNWTPGEPSKTLYIKNLSTKVTDLDLASIFQHFQDPSSPRIVYRLMTSGKMRGQAFVDFHSVQMAEKALQARNGLALKDKPIVIQYARSKD